jgi:hypothetical protein
VRKYIGLIIVVVFYFILTVKVIKWGLPSGSHPYTYHMDEWHQFNSVKSVFKRGTPITEGAAYGTFFYFLLSGLYLAPFYVFGIINPFLIKSDVLNLEMQERIFLILRTNTLLFGIASIILFYKISQKYFKLPFLSTLLFVFTPLWLTLSNYFKYDIALIFWILLYFFSALRFGEKPSLKRYCLASFIAACAFATKISGAPLVLINLLVYFIYKRKNEIKIKELFIGNSIFFLSFLVMGIPFIFYGHIGLDRLLYEVLVVDSGITSNFNLGTHYLPFLLFQQFPTLFGHVAWWIFLLCLPLFIFSLKEKRPEMKNNIVLLSLFFVFFVSLYPVKIFVMNRGLPILPFMVLIITSSLQKIFSKKKIKLALPLIYLLVFIQIFQSLSWVLIKLSGDPKTLSSTWISQNINKGSTIGIMEIPVYQQLPDLILKEYIYLKNVAGFSSLYNYQIIGANSKELPSVVILSNPSIEEYLKVSAKKELLERLNNEGYKEKAVFSPQTKYLSVFTDDLNYYVSNLVPSSEIKIYVKD